jgi:hypothetical protein
VPSLDPYFAQTNTIYLMNSYQLHRGVVSPINMPRRTFLRLILDTPTRQSFPRFSKSEYEQVEKALS